MRPRFLDEQKRRDVHALVSAGCSLTAAARYVGCSARTIRREALRNPEFYDQLRQAETTRQIGPLRAIRRAAETHWRAAAWLLERGEPNQFAPRKPTQYSPDELEEFLVQVLEILYRGIRRKDDLLRVLNELTALGAQYEREVQTAEKPRPDPRRRHRAPIAPVEFSPAAEDDADTDDASRDEVPTADIDNDNASAAPPRAH